MKDRAAESGDSDRVWPHLAQRMMNEYRYAGHRNVAQVKGKFRKAFKAGCGIAYTSDDDQLLAVVKW